MLSALRLGIVEQDVRWLQVAMDDALAMSIVDRVGQDFLDRQGDWLNGFTRTVCVSAYQCVKTGWRGSPKTESEGRYSPWSLPYNQERAYTQWRLAVAGEMSRYWAACLMLRPTK